MASSSITTRPSGKYLARYRDAAGKERTKTFDKGKKSDAQDWLAVQLATMKSGTWVDPDAGKVTFAQWFATWSARRVWADGTLIAAQQAADSVTFADVPMAKIMPLHLDEWMKTMSKPVKGGRKAGLAPSTIRTRYNYVRMTFKAALKNRIISVDPSADVDLPRTRRAEMVMTEALPTSEEVGRVLGHLEGTQFRTFIAVCAFAGLRLGEAAGLQVGDVDFLRRTISVRRQIQGQTEATATVVPPKQGSERIVHVPEELTVLISQHVGDGVWGDDGWLFGSGADTRLNRNSAGNQWRRARKALGISEETTIHSFRHFYASGLIAAGCDVATVQRALGHSSPDITLKVYTHLWPKAEDKTRAAAAELMSSAFADSLRTGDGSQVR